MGLGPSIKMTSLHHYRCPVTAEIVKNDDLEYAGIIVDGVSEVCDDKIYTAKRVGDIAQVLRADGAIVAIDGWGNHHVDFVNVIEQLGIRGIPSVGLSYIGQQGRLVCTNNYVDCVVDFNKNISGYESCVVGDNNLTEYDAMKAVALLKNKLRKAEKYDSDQKDDSAGNAQTLRRLTRKTFHIKEVRFGDETKIEAGVLTIRKGLEKSLIMQEARIKDIQVKILEPGENDMFVNSNLDYSPIACKVRGELGEGVTHLLSGVTVMITGVEDKSGFQPSNIGSSEGVLKNQVVLDRAGTPASSDYILHIDVLFEEGEGRTAEGIMAAHRAADWIVQDIRKVLKDFQNMAYTREEFTDVARPGKPRIIQVKIVSGLGNMYDSSMFPYEPAGFLGSHNMMDSKNIPYVITPNQGRDGAIHSLL
ncbi:glycine/sarcosine/betaine reductase component B subunit [Extibacter muris]|uniref:Proline reductase n=1 Tax=Extibacter muris TaxID=1796622 RepID=A0A4R4FH31_9FIRM|nr:glycine/sarcosine/betaine reductase component B subunit [Extibacter muris]MCU0079044.1 glycine/sarcosine/betaine reductase component B subunit [Extibacter muris]TDA22143.1 proline reductase [Extibacter muris]